MATAITGSLLLACGVRGYALSEMGPIARMLIAGGGLLMIGSGLYLPIIGAALGASAVLLPPPRTARLTT